MHKIIFIILLILFFSCKQIRTKNSEIPIIKEKEKVENKLQKQVNVLNVAFDDFIFKIDDVDKEDFRVKREKDTVYLVKEAYGSIEGKLIQIEETVNVLNISQRYKIGFRQKTVIENQGFDLKVYLERKEQKDSNNLMFVNTENIESRLNEEELSTIKSTSLKQQQKFYQKLLKSKDQYLDCCPEYLEYADDFLSKERKTYLGINELRIYPFIYENTISIEYKIDENIKKKVIIYVDSDDFFD